MNYIGWITATLLLVIIVGLILLGHRTFFYEKDYTNDTLTSQTISAKRYEEYCTKDKVDMLIAENDTLRVKLDLLARKQHNLDDQRAIFSNELAKTNMFYTIFITIFGVVITVFITWYVGWKMPEDLQKRIEQSEYNRIEDFNKVNELILDFKQDYLRKTMEIDEISISTYYMNEGIYDIVTKRFKQLNNMYEFSILTDSSLDYTVVLKGVNTILSHIDKACSYKENESRQGVIEEANKRKAARVIEFNKESIESKIKTLKKINQLENLPEEDVLLIEQLVTRFREYLKPITPKPITGK